MAINNAMKLALKALSYPDIRSTYKIQRKMSQLKPSAFLSPTYKKLDLNIYSNGREVPVRMYTPKEDLCDKILLFFHGGGWVTESIDTYNNVCASLAKRVKNKVVSVEYSLAPENPFPNGLEDCYAVTKAIIRQCGHFNIKPENVVLIGDSAGGNLAAAVSLMARDRAEFCIKKQILLYPATFNDHSKRSPFISIHENGTDYLLTSKRICEYMELYISKKEDYTNPYFAPLLAKNFSNQPQTLIITAEFDPLRDEGEAYGNALSDNGNEVSVYRMKDALHGFFSLDYHFEHVQTAYSLINEFLNKES